MDISDMNDGIDAIELELFKNAVFSIADEMAVTLIRTAYSSVLRDNMDFSTALADSNGQVVAQGLTIAGHLGAIPAALSTVMRQFEDDISPGDVFILNDPYSGGMHLPDIFMFKPIFLDRRRIGFSAAICHHTDVGGRVAGSNAADSTEIFQEGLRLRPVKLYEAGVPNKTLFSIITDNVRVPNKVLGDLRAQLAACRTGEQRLTALATDSGADRLKLAMQAVIDYAERMTRSAISSLPDGMFSFEDWIDDDGVSPAEPIRLHVTIEKRGDSIRADWSGSAPQVRGAINSTLSYTKAATYCAIRSVLTGTIPENEGMFKAIEVIASPGTITNVVIPGACAARGLTGFRMLDCAFGALAQMLPSKVYAASDGGATGISIGGYAADRCPFLYVEFISASWGGRPFADGPDGLSNPLSNLSLPSAEVIEAEHPLQILACEFEVDRAGAGKFRGGAAIRREYRLLEDEAVLQVRSDRRLTLPYGLYGGSPGQASQNRLQRSSQVTDLPAKITMFIRFGDVFTHATAGAGGWGDPLERSPSAVLHDVRNELVSERAARCDYGVVLNCTHWIVEEAETLKLRTQLRAERGWGTVPTVSRGQPRTPAEEGAFT
jgi:N-methylhydantoinase B